MWALKSSYTDTVTLTLCRGYSLAILFSYKIVIVLSLWQSGDGNNNKYWLEARGMWDSSIKMVVWAWLHMDDCVRMAVDWLTVMLASICCHPDLAVLLVQSSWY